MALVACKECRKEISDQAEHCPHCGVRNKTKSSIGCGTIMLGGLVIVILIGAFNSGTPNQSGNPPAKSAAETKADADRTARYACKGFIEKSLHDPASADLSAWTEAAVTNPSANTSIFEVYMRVRAKNAFNAMRLSTMVCRVERNADNWRLINLTQVP